MNFSGHRNTSRMVSLEQEILRIDQCIAALNGCYVKKKPKTKQNIFVVFCFPLVFF